MDSKRNKARIKTKDALVQKALCWTPNQTCVQCFVLISRQTFLKFKHLTARSVRKRWITRMLEVKGRSKPPHSALPYIVIIWQELIRFWPEADPDSRCHAANPVLLSVGVCIQNQWFYTKNPTNNKIKQNTRSPKTLAPKSTWRRRRVLSWCIFLLLLLLLLSLVSSSVMAKQKRSNQFITCVAELQRGGILHWVYLPIQAPPSLSLFLLSLSLFSSPLLPFSFTVLKSTRFPWQQPSWVWVVIMGQKKVRALVQRGQTSVHSRTGTHIHTRGCHCVLEKQNKTKRNYNENKTPFSFR